MYSVVLLLGAVGAHPPALHAARDRGDGAPAKVVVKVPEGARLTIDGEASPGSGTVRTFETPPLPAGKSYAYEIKVEYRRGGKPVTVKRTVRLEAGKTVNLDLTRPTQGTAVAVKPKKVLEITKHPQHGYGMTFETLKELEKLLPAIKEGESRGVVSYRFPTDKEVEELVKKGLLKVVPPRPGDSFAVPREKKTIDD
jgi:uncharacterized protein (TIGR03000 family)